MSSERQSGSAGGQPNDVTARPLDGPGRQADEAAGDAISWHDQGMAGDPLFNKPSLCSYYAL